MVYLLEILGSYWKRWENEKLWRKDKTKKGQYREGHMIKMEED